MESLHYYFSVFYLSVLGTKTQKRIEITLFGNRKQHYQKRVFSVILSFLRTKTLKRIQTRFIKKQTNISKKKIILSIFEIVRTRNRKNAFFCFPIFLFFSSSLYGEIKLS